MAMQNEGWILRSDIIWNQMKGTQSCKDRMRDIYEHIFQFVKKSQYYFDAEKVRIIPEKDAYEKDGQIISATGVSGKKYLKQIELSTVLSEEEKKNARRALNETLDEMRKGEVVDFRMTIRGEQRAYHSDNKVISGRAKELNDKGYFIYENEKEGIPSIRYLANCSGRHLEKRYTLCCISGGIATDPYIGDMSRGRDSIRSIFWNRKHCRGCHEVGKKRNRY